MKDAIRLSTSLEGATLERMQACVNEEFPLCLEFSLQEMLDEKGKKALEAIARKHGIETKVQSPKDVWDLYQAYMKFFEQSLGDSVTRVIALHALGKMESMQCTKCPLYGLEVWKKKLRS